MKNTLLVSFLAILLGSAVGIGASVVEYSKPTFGFSKPARDGPITETSARAAENARPRIQIDQPLFDFGVMSRGETRDHTFVVRNIGEATLFLNFIDKSCQCTAVEMSRTSVPPGETVDIRVAWMPKDYRLDFYQTARFKTNDPSRLEMDLTIKGRVQQIIRTDPFDVTFGNVRQEETREATIDVFGYRDDDLEVNLVEFLNPETADHFSAEVEPMSAERIDAEPGAQSGAVVKLKLKPGLPMGKFYQMVRLRPNKEDLGPIEVAVEGSIVGNVRIIGGPKYNSQTNILELGTLPHESVHTDKLWVMVKDQQGENVDVQIASVEPEGVLEVHLGEAARFGKSTKQLLEVKIVPSGEVINRLGSKQGKLARIVLETSSSDAKQIVIYVAFALLGR